MLLSIHFVAAIPYKNLLAETSIAESSQESSYKYPTEFITTYLNDCVDIAGEHLEVEEARTLCKCTLKKFQTDYTYDQYKKLSPESKQDIGLTCFDEISLEEE